MSHIGFGTDGVRGIANQDLTPEFALQLGYATGCWMVESGFSPTVVMGRDTRRSGPMLEGALAAGFNASGVNVVSLGVVPTPTVAFIARTGEFGLGAILSASHNPAPDNGIKFVSDLGSKLPDSAEARIEQLIQSPPTDRPTGEKIGDWSLDTTSVESYLQFLESLLPERLDGMKIAVDAANGAAYLLGPELLRRLGAEVVEIGTEPDGTNINEVGGATKPDAICRLTIESMATVGVAFDGDADRAIFSDEKGKLINGDRMIAAWASHHHLKGNLVPNAVVGTLMSNGGFEHYLASQNIALERTAVGDKYVAAKLQEIDGRIGGEQSGHIIFPEHGPTGDGLVTMLEFFRVLRQSGASASHFSAAYEPWPQLLINLDVPTPRAWNNSDAVKKGYQVAEANLVGRGRVNLRASGTQPILRMMIEADSYELRDSVASELVGIICRELNGTVYSEVDLTHALGD